MPFIAYLAVLLIAFAGASFGLDFLTAPLPSEPNGRVARNAAAKPVRQIPVRRTTARDDGHSKGVLSPVYPTSAGGAPKKFAAANTPLPVSETTPPSIQPTAKSPKESRLKRYAIGGTRIESANQNSIGASAFASVPTRHTAGASSFASVPTRAQVKPFTATERAAFERASVAGSR